jgi:hypothetical protein
MPHCAKRIPKAIDTTPPISATISLIELVPVQ